MLRMDPKNSSDIWVMHPESHRSVICNLVGLGLNSLAEALIGCLQWRKFGIPVDGQMGRNRFIGDFSRFKDILSL